MNTYVNAHLQQRKSSTYNKTKTLQDNIKFKEVFKQSYTQHQNHRQIPSFQQSHKKQILKPKHQQTQESSQTSRKTQNRLRDEQSSDYIRNLYKKYLGKQNKQPQQKIAVCTERKLKTTQSKQLLTSNTNFKDFTRRTLFNNNDQQNPLLPVTLLLGQNIPQSNQTGIKKQKTKISTLLSKQDQQNETKQPKRTLSNIKIPKSSNDLKYTIQNNRQSLKKQQQKKKDFESRKSIAKNYKSKSKVQKQKQILREDHIKNPTLKRSNSAQIRNQKEQPKKSIKQRTITEQQSQLKKPQDKQQQSIHPHRSSYCQFDTQQQLTNQQNSCTKKLFQNTGVKTRIQAKQAKQPLFYEQKKQDQNLRKTQQGNAKSIYLTYVNNLDQLQTLVGENNSIFRALKRINIVKSKANLTPQRSAFYN